MDELLKAIYFATNAHISQKRKDKITPYIEHPLAVALILSQLTHNQDIIIAGILHDVIEDTNSTQEQLYYRFGAKVTNMVIACSEQDKNLDWSTRKEIVLQKIKDLDHSTALIKAADTLHNLSEAVEKVKTDGIAYFQNFNTDGITKIRYERRRLEELKKYHSTINILDDIENCVAFLERALKIII